MLSAIREYGAKLGGEPGFKARDIRWCIDLDGQGRLLGLLPLGDERAGVTLDRCPDMHAMNAGGKSHFLIESAQTIALHFKTGEDDKKIESAKVRHEFFSHLIAKAADKVASLTGIRTFLADEHNMDALRGKMREQRVKPTDWVTWHVNGADPRVDELVQSWWREWRRADLAIDEGMSDASLVEPMICLLSGESMVPLATHPKITGLTGVGGLAMGDVLVGCDKAAFTSFGLDQSANAAMGSVVAQQYVDGLNDLIKKHSRRLANSLVVYWFKERVPEEEDPLAFLYGLESEDQQTASALLQARNLLDAIRSGQRADLADNHYYAMTLSGAAGRVMVRDWMEGPFAGLVENVVSWFDDLSVVDIFSGAIARDPKFFEVCLALIRNDRNKSISENLKKLPAVNASTLWRAAAYNQHIPSPLFAQALDCFRSALLADEPFSHARIGLIKAYFARNPEGEDKSMKPYLNPEHPNPAYHCGRLLAILAGLQRAALGDVGSGVVQRFYPAASQTPGLTLGRLIANSRNHLGKLDAGLSWWYENEIASVLGQMGDAPPRVLDLQGQGLFALGYYQQLANLRAGKKTDTNDIQSGAIA
ncbi:MAG: type I-C CRISPR-associated protein Cas8c/Csd1 [Steroidobacter sp.]